MLPHPSAQLQPAPGSQRWGLDGTHLWPPQRKVLTPPLSPSADINMLSDPEISAKLFAGCSHPVLAQAQEASVSWSDAILCQGSGMLLLLALWKPKCNSCSALTLLFCLFSLLFCVVQGMMRWPGGAAAIENGLFVSGLSNSSPVLKQMWRYCKTPQKKKKKNHLPLALTLLVLQGGQGVQWLFGQAVTFSLCFLHPQKSSREELMDYREGCPRSRVSFPAPQSVSHRCKNLTLGLCYPS